MKGDAIDVSVAYAAPGMEALVRVRLASGSVVADAVAASGLLDRHELDPREVGYAIFGALVVDPKEARRRRAEAALLRPRHPKAKRDRSQPE